MEEDLDGKQWEAYTDYDTVVKSNHRTIVNARRAYTFIVAMHSHGKKIKRERCVKAKSRILDAAVMLQWEIEYNSGEDPFGDIWERWSDSEDEDGFLSKLHEMQIERSHPDWLQTCMDDIIRAAWEIGYLKVGRHEHADPEDDSQQVREALK